MEGQQKIGAYIMIGLMVLLFGFAIVQAFQIGILEDSISGAGGVVAAASPQPAAPARSAPQQQPAMVGGC